MSIFGSSAGKATIGAAQENKEHLAAYYPAANKEIRDFAGRAQGYLDKAGSLYEPLSALGQKATGLYSDALGLNGAAGNANATSAFQTAPGYQFQMDQGLQALERRAAAQGRMQSGQTGVDTMTYAQGLANQGYNDWLSNLSGVGSLWQTGVSGQAGVLGAQAGVEVGTGDRLGELGDSILSGFLAANNQKAQGREAQAQAKDAQMGSLLSLGTSILGGGLGGIGGAVGGGTSLGSIAKGIGSGFLGYGK